MLNQKAIEEITGKLNEMMASSPARDVEKNLRAILAGVFARLDLVTREEFDIQREVLTRTREKLEALEAKLAELEKGREA
jgi:BMFP domain-containing protein YqiC